MPAVQFLCSQNLWLGSCHRNTRCYYTSFCILAYCLIRKAIISLPFISFGYSPFFISILLGLSLILMLLWKQWLCLTYKINVSFDLWELFKSKGFLCGLNNLWVTAPPWQNSGGSYWDPVTLAGCYFSYYLFWDPWKALLWRLEQGSPLKQLRES